MVQSEEPDIPSVPNVVFKSVQNQIARVKKSTWNKNKKNGTTSEELDLRGLCEKASRLKPNDRRLSVEELLQDFVRPHRRCCMRYAAASLVFLVLPLVFDYTLFTERLDYTEWRCIEPRVGICANITVFNKQMFCENNPRASVPNSAFFSNPDTQGTQLNQTVVDGLFIRGVHYYWIGDTASSLPVLWNMYCDNETSSLHEMVYVGMVISGVISGWLVDRFGRRACVVSSSVLGSVLVILFQVFIDSYSGLVAWQVLLGLVYTCYLLASLLWLLENLPHKYRPAILLLLASYTALSRFLLAILASELIHYKHISVGILVVCLATTPCLCLLPESLQFLISHHLDTCTSRALGTLSGRWREYRNVLELHTTSNKSHREEASFTALFTHRDTGYRVDIVLYLWSCSFLVLTSRSPPATNLAVHYVIRAGLCWVTQLIALATILYIPKRTVFCGSLLAAFICNILTISIPSFILNLVVQVFSEVCYVILLLLTFEVTSMPQRGRVMGCGFSLLGAAALLNSRFMDPGGGGDDMVYRAIVSGFMLCGVVLSYLLPANRAGILHFTVSEAKGTNCGKTIVLVEKNNGLEENNHPKVPNPAVGTPESPSADPGQSNTDTRFEMMGLSAFKGKPRIIHHDESSVDRYLFLDTSNRQVDVQLEKRKGRKGKEKAQKRLSATTPITPTTPMTLGSPCYSDASSMVIVNIYRDQVLEHKSKHKRTPSFVIDHSSETSEIHDIHVMDAKGISGMLEETDIAPVGVKRRNPQSSASYMDVVMIHPNPIHEESANVKSEDPLPASFPSSPYTTRGLTLEFTDEDSDTYDPCWSSKLPTPGTGISDLPTPGVLASDPPTPGTLQKFNTYMHLERVSVSSWDTSDRSCDFLPRRDSDRWRHRMCNLEMRYDGENTEYIRYLTPTEEPSRVLVPVTLPLHLPRPGEITELDFNMSEESPVIDLGRYLSQSWDINSPSEIRRLFGSQSDEFSGSPFIEFGYHEM